MDFWTRLEAVRSRNNVLEHPFYQRWSAGELTVDELAFYAGEYDQAVRGLAEASAATAEEADGDIRDELRRHAAEEDAHIALWQEFAVSVGGELGGSGTDARSESVACREAWAGAASDGLLHGLVTLYSIESGQPEISDTKRKGLVEFYGMAEGPATAYFDLHSELDKEHAASARELIEQRLEEADVESLLATAERAFQANWKLLDGVEAEFGR